MTNPSKFPAGAAPVQARRFNWLILTLATLGILVAGLAAIQASWLGKSSRESAAAAALEQMGASVHWAWRLDARIVEKRVPAAPPPSWLCPGDSFVCGVHLLFCDDPHLNEKLQWLETLRGLRCLAVTNAPVSQAALRHLAGLSRLEWLDLHDTPLTDDAVRYVSAHRHLEWLNLQNTQITDGCLPNLARFQRLKWLNVSGTGVTPAGLAYLRSRLPNTAIKYNVSPSLAARDRSRVGSG